MAEKHTCRGCGTRTRKQTCPECGRVWRELGEILAQDASKPAEAPATAPKAETRATEANSTLGDRMSWTIAPRHMHPGAEPVEVIQPEQWRQPSLVDEFGEWLDAHPEFAVACVCLCIGLCAAAAVLWGR